VKKAKCGCQLDQGRDKQGKGGSSILLDRTSSFVSNTFMHVKKRKKEGWLQLPIKKKEGGKKKGNLQPSLVRNGL